MNHSQMDAFASPYDNLDTIGFEYYDDDDEIVIGEDGVIIGKRKKVNVKKAVKRGKQAVEKGKKTFTAIQKASTHPATLATIAATASIVPFGTVAAGLATVGLGLVNGIAAVAGPIFKGIGKAFKAVGSLFKGKKGRAKARAAKAKAKAAAKKRLQGGVGVASKMLAKQIILANKGDPKAQAGLVSLKAALKSPDALKGMNLGENAPQFMKFLKVATQRADLLASKYEKLKPPPKASKARNVKIQTNALKAINAGTKVAQSAVQRRLAVKRDGILVTGSKIKRGKFAGNGKKAGYLVAPGGMVTKGNWT